MTVPPKYQPNQVELMGALKEVSMQETETPWMFKEYRYILDNADQINKVKLACREPKGTTYEAVAYVSCL